MYLADHARCNGEKAAVVVGETGGRLTYAELDGRSLRVANLLRSRGVVPGDVVAILLENRLEYFELLWAATRYGLYLTTINRHLTGSEAGYILRDCGAVAILTSDALLDVATQAVQSAPHCTIRLNVDGARTGFEDYNALRDATVPERLPVTPRGEFMLYSSGTTGRPKGIKRRLSGDDVSSPPLIVGVVQLLLGVGSESVYLSTAPLYHAAPLGWSLAAQYLGATVVILERFDPVAALESIERYGVTHSQWVPAMFNRMLQLPLEVRERFDLTSMQAAIHAAAPCPLQIKQRMLAWWGPIIHEYYAGTEGIGMTYASPQDWLDHPGSVGRSMLGRVRICDAYGAELPVGDDGEVYFEEVTSFEYHGDAEKTRSAHHPELPGWATMGDIGHVDDDGFLYLTDRKGFVINSGGVNIYPQEIENVLITHPAVEDAAVIGVPHEDMGEQVLAVIQPIEPDRVGPELESELLQHCRTELAGYKLPRRVEFVEELPRLPNGKLYKSQLKAKYAMLTNAGEPSEGSAKGHRQNR